MYCNSAESFGKQWQIGDVVGAFLDLIDHTISKMKRLPFSNFYTFSLSYNFFPHTLFLVFSIYFTQINRKLLVVITPHS